MSIDITVYGANWRPDCRRSKHFLSEHQIVYHWVDIEQDEQARAYVEKLNDGKRTKYTSNDWASPATIFKPRIRSVILKRICLLRLVHSTESGGNP